MKLEVNKYYKTAAGDTMYCCILDLGVYYCVWHEQALDEPNHAHIAYSSSGFYIIGDICSGAFSVGSPSSTQNIVRECTEKEMREIEGDLREGR